MRLRTYYALALLCPLIVLAVVAGFNRADAELGTGLGPGGAARWLYPTSPVRGLLAYGIVATWLARALHRRRPDAFEALLWLAPVVYVFIHVSLLGLLVLLHGRAGDFLSQHGELVGLRLFIRLLIGFGYVGLVVIIRRLLWPGGVQEGQEGNP